MGGLGYIELETLLKNEPRLQLQLLAGKDGVNRRISSVDVNRPGLALAGFYKCFASDRIQVIGKGEYAYLQEFSDLIKEGDLADFFAFEYPAIVFTHGNLPSGLFLEQADRAGVPLLSTQLSTHDFITYYSQYINMELAPMEMIHGVMMEIFGIGVLLLGESGIGKSENALELLERGHRLVADDMVEIKCIANRALYGSSNEMIRYHMELRGLGIINVKDMFGLGAIRDEKKIEVVILLQVCDSDAEIERTGLDDGVFEMFGIKLPKITIPVRPGRNIPILIETAAMNQRSKKMGYYAAREFSHKVTKAIQKKANKSIQ